MSGNLVERKRRYFKMSLIMVVGDFMIDDYFLCEYMGLHRNAPIFKHQQSISVPGGAGNVAANIDSLGESSMLISVLGRTYSDKIPGIFIQDRSRKTTVKRRLIMNGQQLLRMDVEDAAPISVEIENQLIANIYERISFCDSVVISDHGKGVITDRICTTLIDLANKMRIPVIVEPKRKDFTVYRWSTVITTNRKRFSEAINIPFQTTPILETLGQDGMLLHNLGLKYRIPGIPLHGQTDGTGAGDVVAAALAVFMSRYPNAAIYEAAEWANRAAAISVTKLGTSIVTNEEMKRDCITSPNGYHDFSGPNVDTDHGESVASCVYCFGSV